MANMKAVRIHRFGGPDVLQIEEIPVPEPKDDEILVKVDAASVNPVDYKIRSGHYSQAAGLPFVLGRDLAGSIEALGPSAKGEKGELVFALLGPGRGSYAEYAIVKPGEYIGRPEDLDHVRAAAVPLAGITAWQGLFDHGHLEGGQRALIHGGAGGVGHFAVQFAKAREAYVITTASRDDFDFVRELGADEAIDYKGQRFEDLVHGVDLVFDLVGGETQARSFAVLKPGGIIVSALQEPPEDELKRHGVRGVIFRAHPDDGELAAIADLIEQGEVTPVVSATYPLDKAADAHKRLEAGHVRGKIVLDLGF
jgi:NADPH:quinone reductase-like Zn-dependent oxidoreductase